MQVGGLPTEMPLLAQQLPTAQEGHPDDDDICATSCCARTGILSTGPQAMAAQPAASQAQATGTNPADSLGGSGKRPNRITSTGKSSGRKARVYVVCRPALSVDERNGSAYATFPIL
jgi:hypothetical protein